jgi:hypothetical protein
MHTEGLIVRETRRQAKREGKLDIDNDASLSRSKCIEAITVIKEEEETEEKKKHTTDITLAQR